MPNLLLIDDEQPHLAELVAALETELRKDDVEIRQWVPQMGDDAERSFNERVDPNTSLVITDYNLTDNGQTGLFGSTIVGWCQARAIPVGDFSRANRSPLPKQPNQYEIRIPSDANSAAKYIAGTFRGFVQIQRALDSAPELIKKKRSPVSVLSEILGRPKEESRFALYGGRVGAANAALVDIVTLDGDASEASKRKLTCYIVGHLLLNVILRFPGPLLNERVLAAYLAIADAEIGKVKDLFAKALYNGPFSDIGPFYWLSDVDAVLDDISRAAQSDSKAETSGQLNREAVESKLRAKLARHECPRCKGLNGGFFCPFTNRTVCQLPYCSVGSNGWIPQGARLCRIEKDFYDEWAPMLGF